MSLSIDKLDLFSIFLFLLLLVVGGAIACATFLILLFLARRNFAVDREGKHGISQKNASRMGGVAVTLSLLAYLFYFQYFDDKLFGQFSEPTLVGFELMALVVALIGMLDDFGFGLSAKVRLFLNCSLTALFFLLYSNILPMGIVDELRVGPLFNHLMVFCLSVFVFVGFVNAGNIADGANGLLAIVACCLFFAAFYISEQSIYLLYLFSLGIFIVYNCFSGKIFLGDFGSYLLSGTCVLVCFELFNHYEISIWFFAAILSYPCIEIFRSLAARLVAGGDLLKADNHHFHNLLHQKLLRLGLNPVLANSTTGIGVSVFFSAPPIIILVLSDISLVSSVWFALFACQFALLFLLYFYLERHLVEI